MQVAKTTPSELASTIRRLYKSHRFLVAVETLSGIAIYAGETTATDTLIEARTEHPYGVILVEWEYLSNETRRTLAGPEFDALHKV